MSTAVVFNGYGHYETNNDGQKGITLRHGGVEFWMPYDQVTYIPDYTMREIDHEASTASGEDEGVLTYKTFRISGERIAEELLETQIPFKNSYMGIILIANDLAKRQNSYVKVLAGVSDSGQKLYTEVQEIKPTAFEIAEAHRLATVFKEAVIQQYFQGKRERMMGGFGHQPFPTGLIRTYMEELDVQDIDDIAKKSVSLRDVEDRVNSPGMTPEMFMIAIKELIGGSSPTPAVPAQKPAAGKVQADAKSLV